MNECQKCAKENYKQLYTESKQTFEKQIFTLTTALYILIGIVAFCLVLTIITEIKVVNFINGFEYVEETEYEISQDSSGTNVAVIGERNEVKTYGADRNSKEEKVLETENKYRSEESNSKKSKQ
jgi:hypothetical protein